MRAMIMGASRALLGVVALPLTAGAQFKPVERGTAAPPATSFGPTVTVPSTGAAGGGAGGSPPIDTRPIPVPQGADGCPPGQRRIDGVCQ